MADENGAAQSAQTLPVPEFYFSVEISNVGKITCKEVSGLDAELGQCKNLRGKFINCYLCLQIHSLWS